MARKIPAALKRIVDAKKKFPAASHADLSRIIGTTPGNVSGILRRYRTTPEAVSCYVDHKADVFDGTAARILRTIDDAAIKAAGLRDRAVAIGILDDKSVRARGQATSIVDVRSLQITATMSSRRVEIMQAARKVRGNNSNDTE